MHGRDNAARRRQERRVPVTVACLLYVPDKIEVLLPPTYTLVPQRAICGQHGV